MHQIDKKFVVLTKSGLIAECSEKNISWTMNGKPVNDWQFIEQLLTNEGGIYNYSVEIGAPDELGQRIGKIKYDPTSEL